MKFKARIKLQAIWVAGVLLLLTGCSDSYPSVQALYRDYLAQQDLKKEEYETALNRYYQVLEVAPQQASVHSNIGVLLGSMQQTEEERKSLLYALELAQKSGNPQELFALHFNLGVHYGRAKSVAEALDHYQAALDIQPDSVEVKTNIELLIQQNQSSQGEQGSSSEKQKGSESQNNQSNQSQNDQDKKDQDQSGQNQEQKDRNENKQDDGRRESSAKYKPRPYQGEQLSEGDVKKILGELRNQEQRIRANFDKKEKGKSYKNEKDW